MSGLKRHRDGDLEGCTCVCYKKQRGVFEMVKIQAIDQQKGPRKVKQG